MMALNFRMIQIKVGIPIIQVYYKLILLGYKLKLDNDQVWLLWEFVSDTKNSEIKIVHIMILSDMRVKILNLFAPALNLINSLSFFNYKDLIS